MPRPQITGKEEKNQSYKWNNSAQIHANLAWKLKDLMNIDVKKTKIFKFIDY